MQVRLEPTWVKPELNSYGRLLVVPSNNRLLFEWLTVTNTLAYYDTEWINIIKCFIVQATVLPSNALATTTSVKEVILGVKHFVQHRRIYRKSPILKILPRLVSYRLHAFWSKTFWPTDIWLMDMQYKKKCIELSTIG